MFKHGYTLAFSCKRSTERGRSNTGAHRAVVQVSQIPAKIFWKRNISFLKKKKKFIFK